MGDVDSLGIPFGGDLDGRRAIFADFYHFFLYKLTPAFVAETQCHCLAVLLPFLMEPTHRRKSRASTVSQNEDLQY